MNKLILTFAVALSALAFAGSAGAANFFVTTTADAPDVAPGNGVCADASGACTLRAAVMEANALPGWDNVYVRPATYLLTNLGPCEDGSVTGDIDIRSELSIIGYDPVKTIVSGLGSDRVFDVLPGANAYITKIGVRSGYASSACGSAGAGIQANGAHLRLVDDFLVGNNADKAGGAVAAWGGYTLLERVTLVSNTARAYGGGVFLTGGGSAWLTNDTVTYNQSGYQGGGVWVGDSHVELTNVTVASNSSSLGGGIAAPGIAPVAFDSIVAYNSGHDCFGVVASGGANDDTDFSCGFFAAGDLPGVDPLLDVLVYGLGPTPVRPLLPGSPVLNAGNNATCASNDQRLLARPQGPACEIGAVEM
jgi:CSLREA domain-containing protein